MKNLSTLFLAFLLTKALSAQIIFEKGYFIDNNHQKKVGYVKNTDWKNNPTGFEFRLTENGSSQIRTLDNTAEFGIDGFSKYIKAEVLVETSSSDVNQMKHTPTLETQKIKTFLKVLVLGKANLLYYEQGNLRQFFIQLDTNPIKPLFYKEYLKGANVATFAPFRQHLYQFLKCECLNLQDFERLKYKYDELVALFETYNRCVNPDSKTQTVKIQKQKQKLNFKIIAPQNIHDVTFIRFTGAVEPILKGLTPGLGFEVEGILPFNKNKWGVSVAPNFYFFDLSKQCRYTAFEVPIQIRHYFFLNNNNKLFLSGGYNLNFPLIEVIQTDFSVGLSAKTACWTVGAGYAFKKWRAEVRYYTPQSLVAYSLYEVVDYQKRSLIVSYQF